MNLHTQRKALVIGFALLLAASYATDASAQYYRRGTFVMAGGITSPIGDADEFMNSSGVLQFAFGRHINRSFSMQVEWTHNWLSVDSEVYDRAAAESLFIDNAYASMWSMTLNGIYRFRPDAEIVPWVTGGVGYYKRNIQITEDAWVYVPPFWDPWWGWVDGGWYPGEAITGSRETGAFGYNVGFGIDLPIDQGAAMFVEVRFHHAFTEGVETMVVPVMAGVRW